MAQKQFNDAKLGEIGYSLEIAVWRPDGTCYEESSVSISTQEYEELFGRFILRQESKPDDFVHQALKAQAARIRQLEQQVRNLGGNPNENKIACNYFWDAEEKRVFKEAGGGWDGIEAVVQLDQRRFLNGKS